MPGLRARLFLLSQWARLAAMLAPDAPVDPARIEALRNRISALETTITGLRRRLAGCPDRDTQSADQGTMGGLHNQVAE